LKRKQKSNIEDCSSQETSAKEDRTEQPPRDIDLRGDPTAESQARTRNPHGGVNTEEESEDYDRYSRQKKKKNCSRVEDA